MNTCISDDEAGQLLAAAKDLLRLKPTTKSNNQQQAWQRIHHQLSAYTYPINYLPMTVEQIPLPIRRCFVRAVLLLTRYPELGGQHTGGTYNSPILSSYRCDHLTDSCYQGNAAKQLGQLFKLSKTDAQDVEDLLERVDRQIKQQQTIMQALSCKFNQLKTQQDTLQLFQALFGEITLPEASLNCLTTKMQLVFLLDYQSNRLRSEHLWLNLATTEQQQITQFLTKISQFNFKQFANFPSFGYIEADKIEPYLIQHLIQATGYSKSAIISVIASSTNIVTTDKAESFLLHDTWGHYWQSILTGFDQDYQYLSRIELGQNDTFAIEDSLDITELRYLFKLTNGIIKIDQLLAKNFFERIANKCLASLTTHLIGEMLADINEYKWLTQNQHSQDSLNSSSYFKDYPTKLDLTLKDLNFLFPAIFTSLTKLNISKLETELINQFRIKEQATLLSLRKAIVELKHIFLTQYIRKYQFSLNSKSKSYWLGLKLLRLQNILNQLYTHSDRNISVPCQDLILLFVSNYYLLNSKQDLNQLNLGLANYFYPCCLLLTKLTLCGAREI